MTVLVHGTTRKRADRIVEYGPDLEFVEPGGSGKADGFSTCVASGQFPLGTPDQYARCKSALFPTEGDPVLLFVDVPVEIIASAVDAFFPLSQYVVQFNRHSLDALRKAWRALPRWIEAIEDNAAH